ncbi:MAG: diadenylate cyclase CdaA [Candidatus Omnitrophica bacterium]|nr:diadenylate cyclase CdaA [Candidatus Omnitrophota bacterium]
MLDFLSEYWKYFLEIFILWFFYYTLLVFIKGTRALQVLKGLVILGVVFLLTQEFQLGIINWILSKLLTISVIAFVIIFQPELRRGLARIGQFGIFYKEKQTLDDIAKAAIVLAKQKCGALIAIEREIGLKTYIESGVQIDSQVTSELINTIFSPNTPLHDGGVIVQGSRIVAAGCLFPLTQNPYASKALGTRHRAGMGLSEETDALVLIVSEETGTVSIASEGVLTRNIDIQNLSRVLAGIYRPRSKGKSFFDILSKTGKSISSTES